MPAKRKRGAEVAENITSSPPSSFELDRIRNMEEFAALGQYLFMFGVGALNLPDFGREELERALLAPQSPLVEQIKLTLIKAVTSNTRLLIEQFDDQARKQYLLNEVKTNPFEGDNMATISFDDMDLSIKICVLHQLSIWTFKYPNLLRERMGDIDISEELLWRMEPAGYDAEDNEYFILDDNRLYRRASWKEAAASPHKKKKSQTSRAGRKRKRIPNNSSIDSGEALSKVDETREWSCVCISLDDWEKFVSSLKGSKDADEKALYEYLDGDVLPEIRRSEELKQKKLLDIEKERQKQEAIANRKRSSRIDEKMIRKREEELKAAEERRQVELLKKTQAEERKREKEREVRLAAYERQITRQNNAREKKLQTQDVGCSRVTSGDESSVNSRRASTRVQTRRSRRSPSVEEKEDDWVFDCRCGVHEKKHAGGSTIIACDKCAVWQHLACQNLPPSFIEGDFTCERCMRREMDNKKRVTIKLHIGGSTKDSPMDLHKGHESALLESLSQPASLPRASQSGIQEGSKLLVSGNSGGQERHVEVDSLVPLKPTMNHTVSALSKPKPDNGTGGDGVVSVREESAQASADFLLLMADPEHGISDLQKTGNLRILASQEENYQSHQESSKPLNGNSGAAPSGFVTSLSSPSTCTPFMDTHNNNTDNSPGKSDTYPYHGNPNSRNIFTGPVSPANFKH
ncbi:hypothetical protein DFP73DRAFT_559762 [Morchella snyderi]|nr:hypothetical protein DFP73DRAFT_559762 [Morchella snyderi]